ncbi:dephospho-CoA kinase [Aerosakkonemataceae cyanobacterium BLCC-F154]|uniref:Dephospho-CoA kinase n=1 Tax=Floridaenema fluviatile BLCC-F154 TaxID=3153640 RepID=A0ABV4Y7Y0_9CYAN
MNQRKIGLTGGISTGKTTVSNYLANTYHLPILDADIYAREAVETGSPILNQISQRYGKEILLADGTLNRQKLGEIIFPNKEERLWLEQQIHPYVRQRFAEAMNQLPSNSTVILVIPLLFEAKLTNLVTEIWVVFVKEQQQIQRLMQRNNLTLEQAKARINSQMPLAEKCQKADVILDNSGSLEFLYQQIDAALNS